MTDSHLILYIDDDQDYLDSVRIILESGGFRMVEAHGAEEGLEVFERDQPDLVLADLMMEEVDSGTGFVRDLRLKHEHVPVYLLSSVGDTLELNLDFGQLGLSGVFQKPVDASQLLPVLRSKLEAISAAKKG